MNTLNYNKLQQGVAAHKNGELKTAENIYKSILKSNPSNPDANHNLGILALTINKDNKALQLLEAAVRANPKIEQYWISYINALMKFNKFEVADKIIQKAKNYGFQIKYPDNTKPKRSLNNEIETAKNNLFEKKISILLNKYEKGQYKQAEKLARVITSEYPLHSLSWKVLGTVFKKTGRLMDALFAENKAVQINPKDYLAHNNLGVTLFGLDKFSEAESSYKEAIILKPDFVESHINLSVTLYKQNRLQEAEASCRQAIKLKPDSFEAYCNLGNILRESAKLEESVLSYKKAIMLNPNSYETYNNLGSVLIEQNKFEQAELYCKKSITLKPNLAEAHFHLGITLYMLKKFEEASISFTEATILKPNYSQAHSKLGSTLKELDKIDEAVSSYKQALTVNPNDLTTKHLLAALTGKRTATAPIAYIEGLFDFFAPGFDKSMVNNLGYKTPKAISELIIQNNNFKSLGSMLDLGCGTGLLGTEIKHFSNNLVGVDLSNKMLNEAKKKNIYNELFKDEIINFLSKRKLNFNYFVAIDVFIYVGDLDNFFSLIKSRNKTGGKLVFSTEHYDGEDFILLKSGRYAHSKNYIESLCKKFNYKLSHFHIETLRKENNFHIEGGLYLLDF